MTTLATRPTPARNRSGTRAGRRVAVTVGAALVLLLTVLASFALGSRQLGVDQVWHALVAPDGGDASTIVRELRMPRTALGLAVGLALAVAGVLFQALTRNPLAEPRILGISAGASFGVVLAISVFGVGTLAGYVWFGIAGALIAGLLVFAIAARAREGASPVTLALVGAALDASLARSRACSASTPAPSRSTASGWSAGWPAGTCRSPRRCCRSSSSAWCSPPWWPAAWTRWPSATTWPVVSAPDRSDPARWWPRRRAADRRRVAAAGPVAFVGLAVPHLARALVGADHRWTLAVSALLGPALLLAADIVGRLVAPPGEIPAGIVTALIGAPLLAVLVRRARVVTA